MAEFHLAAPLSLILCGGPGPSPQARLWGAPSQTKRSRKYEEAGCSKPTPLGLQETAAESVFIGRPLVHRILPVSPLGFSAICN